MRARWEEEVMPTFYE